MLDEQDLTALYSVDYRPMDPTVPYLRDQRTLARVLAAWVERHLPGLPSGRRVLDVGCGAGLFLETFREQGWQTTGIDANSRWTHWGRTTLGLDLQTGFYDRGSFPGQRFSLILFSHILEHVPEPEAILTTLRDALDEDGYLFIGIPDVLRARPGKVYPELMAGPHVVLYSPRTVTRLLHRMGFTVEVLDHWYPRGMRILARKRRATETLRDPGRDDWKMLRALYRGLLRPAHAGLLEKNLAALLPHRAPVLEWVSAKALMQPYRLVDEAGSRQNLEKQTPKGVLRMFLSGAAALTVDEPDPSQDAIEEGTLVIQVGLGLGYRALEWWNVLAPRNGRLAIYEPDPAVALAAFRTSDLTALLASDRVLLYVGSRMEIGKVLRAWHAAASNTRVVTDPDRSQPWCARYEPMTKFFESGRWTTPTINSVSLKVTA
jgi:2-polyprenyl-3-methyl-5-hydroxy-6-metoxy-1,4-benzoquinol methylase